MAVDVEGSIRAWAIRLSEAKAEIRIEVRTGSRAYQEASDSAAARFGLSGGERAASAELEAVVDAPGLEVRPARHRDDVRTDNGHQTWRSIVSGDLLDAEVWVTLFAGNRYVQATKVGLEDAAVQP